MWLYSRIMNCLNSLPFFFLPSTAGFFLLLLPLQHKYTRRYRPITHHLVFPRNDFDFILFGIVDVPVYTLPLALMADINCVNIWVKRRDRINKNGGKEKIERAKKELSILVNKSTLFYFRRVLRNLFEPFFRFIKKYYLHKTNKPYHLSD